MDILNTSRRALKPLQDKENRLLRTRERERARRAAETAEQRQERSTKRREIGLGHCQKWNDTDFALFGNVRYISVTRTSCFTTGAYGGSNSNFSNELTLSVNVLLTIYSPSAISPSHRYLQCWLLKVTEFAIRDSISTVFSHIEV